MESSGLKASFSAVINGDKVDYGVHYEDTDGVSINHEDSCLMDDVEDEASRVIFKVVSDYLTQRKQLEQKAREKAAKFPVDSITVSTTSTLEEENKRLNDKIAELEGRIAKMEKPIEEVQGDSTKSYYEEQIESLLKFLGY